MRRASLCGFVLLVGLGAGCGIAEVAGPAPSDELPSEAGPLDALNRRHARLRDRMQRRGYGAYVALTRAFVLEDHGVAYPLDLSAGKCSTFVALGGGSIRDITLTLYDGDGAEAATESVEGEGGLLHVCPQTESGVRVRPYHLVVRAREGVGAVILAQFRSEPGAGEGFDGVFEGVLAPRVPFRDVEEHLARSRTALRARGFTPLGAPLLQRVTEGSVARLPVALEAGHCYVATGRSGEGLLDIDLFLFDGAGVEVARDLGADAEPSIEHCPSADGRHLLEIRAYEGAGAVGLMVFRGPGDDPDVAQPVEPGSEEGSADPSVALDVLAAPLQRRGFAAPLFVSRDAAIVPGEVRTHDVVVGPGCALIAGTASHEGLDLDLYLADEAGGEVDRDTAVQSTARVRACRDQATVLRVAVKGYGRDGTYALAMIRAPDAVSSLQDLRLEELTAAYRLRGYEERLATQQALETGERLRRQLSVGAGDCVAIAVAGDDGAIDVDLVLRDPAGQPVATDVGRAPHATVSRCTEASETLTLEVTMVRGAGEIALRVLQPTSSAATRGAPGPRGSAEELTPDARSGTNQAPNTQPLAPSVGAARRGASGDAVPTSPRPASAAPASMGPASRAPASTGGARTSAGSAPADAASPAAPAAATAAAPEEPRAGGAVRSGSAPSPER